MHSGRDHTLHASVEGYVGWSKDPITPKKRTYIHVIPAEMPNRKFPAPPPFVYHPELFPELAKNNPTPSNLDVPKAQPKRQRNPKPLGAKKVESPRSRINVNITPEVYKMHKGTAYEKYDYESLKELEMEIQPNLRKYFGREDLRI